MAFHQSGVYAGTIVGGTFAGLLAEYYGWRCGFYVFGILGTGLGIVLLALLKEPVRGQADVDRARPRPAAIAIRRTDLFTALLEIFLNPTVLVLIAVFTGANFVAAIVLTWMPMFLHDKFDMHLAKAGFSATAYLQVGSVLGVLAGGFVGDKLASQFRGGRMLTQALGLFLGGPLIFLIGWTMSVPILVFKGIYDANIWASLCDVVRAERRATSVGVMNSIGWVGGAAAPVALAAAAQHYGMSASLSANSLIYLCMGVLLCFGIWTLLRTRREVIGVRVSDALAASLGTEEGKAVPPEWRENSDAISPPADQFHDGPRPDGQG
jgi:sugar phosphate permease